MKKNAFVAAAVSGALVASLALAGCAPKAAEEKKADDAAKAAAAAPTGSAKVTLHRGYAAAHGDKCFTEVVVAVGEDGTILAANIDDYQFMASTSQGITPVPNSDKGFAAGIKEGNVLVSKALNSDVYSKNMKEKGGATQDWGVSMKAIEEFAKGKKPADLESVSGPDAVSGATLADTANYLKAVATVAKDGTVVSEGKANDVSKVALKKTLAAAHGDKCYTSAVVLVEDGTIVAASVDDFQFTSADSQGITPVPNSDKSFGQTYADGQTLISKSVNSPVYSKNMMEKGGATQEWLKSMAAVESFVAGKKPADLSSVSGPDAVSGATLADTAGYVKAIADAAQAK